MGQQNGMEETMKEKLMTLEKHMEKVFSQAHMAVFGKEHSAIIRFMDIATSWSLKVRYLLEKR